MQGCNARKAKHTRPHWSRSSRLLILSAFWLASTLPPTHAQTTSAQPVTDDLIEYPSFEQAFGNQDLDAAYEALSNPDKLQSYLENRKTAQQNSLQVQQPSPQLFPWPNFGGPSPYQKTLSLEIPIPDRPERAGLSLWATLLRPHGPTEPRSTVVISTPYRRELIIFLYDQLVHEGFNLLIVDVTGTGSSEGSWSSFGREEQIDLSYVIDEYIPAQPWSNGLSGMAGGSYLALSQMLGSGLVKRDADGTPVHLKALFPEFAFADSFSDIVFQGGILNLGFVPMWLGTVDLLSIAPPLVDIIQDGRIDVWRLKDAFKSWADHLRNIPVSLSWLLNPDNMVFNPFFEERSPMLFWPVKPKKGWDISYGNQARVPDRVPILYTAGWRDMFLRGTLRNFQHGKRTERVGERRLIIGDWYHMDGILMPSLNSITDRSLAGRWFRWQMEGSQESFMSEFPVLMYIRGAERWRAEKDWPLPKDRVQPLQLNLSYQPADIIEGDWFSHENRHMNFRLTDDAQSDTFDVAFDVAIQAAVAHPPISRHEPGNLRGKISESSVRWTGGLADLPFRAAERFLGWNADKWRPWKDEREDAAGALTFTTAPFTQDVEINGPLTLRFWARSTFEESLVDSAQERIVNLVGSVVGGEDNLIKKVMRRKDVQWIAEIEDIHHDGSANHVTAGWLSSWFRPYLPEPALLRHPIDPDWTANNPFYLRPFKEPRPIEEGELYEYAIEIWPTAHVFKQGHRLRLVVSHSDFPHLLPNLNPSSSEIVIDADHPARLTGSIVNTKQEGVLWEWVDDPDGWIGQSH